MKHKILAIAFLALTVNAGRANAQTPEPHQKMLDHAVAALQSDPNLSVVMVNGDDSTGEYLTGKGIDAKRISEHKTPSGKLSMRYTCAVDHVCHITTTRTIQPAKAKGQR